MTYIHTNNMNLSWIICNYYTYKHISTWDYKYILRIWISHAPNILRVFSQIFDNFCCYYYHYCYRFNYKIKTEIQIEGNMRANVFCKKYNNNISYKYNNEVIISTIIFWRIKSKCTKKMMLNFVVTSILFEISLG